MENEAATKTPIPTHRESVFSLLSPVSGLRSSVVHLTNVPLLCVLCDLCGLKPFLQNKANVTMGNINISTARTKAYANKQRTMNTELDSKQTPSNPIPPPPSCAGKESRISERNTYPDLSGQHQKSRIHYRESSIFPILPRNHRVIAQNKPNSRKAKTNATPYAAKDYENNARPAARKKQTQTNPIPAQNSSSARP